MIARLRAYLFAWLVMPRRVEEWQSCIQFCLHGVGKVLPEDGKFMFDPYTERTSEEIAAIRVGDYVGYYRITRRYYLAGQGAGSDWAGWDDGLCADLKRVRIQLEPQQ